ncbi:hypothetical protein, partial [Bacillus anthracis]
NTEVKLSSADGSWDLVPVRVGRRQATKNTSLLTCVFFVFKQYAKRSNGNTNTLPKDESYYIRD